MSFKTSASSPVAQAQFAEGKPAGDGSTTKSVSVAQSVQELTLTQEEATVSLQTDAVVSPNVQTLTISQNEVTVTGVQDCIVYPPCLNIGPYPIAYDEKLRPLYRIAKDLYLTL